MLGLVACDGKPEDMEWYIWYQQVVRRMRSKQIQLGCENFEIGVLEIIYNLAAKANPAKAETIPFALQSKQSMQNFNMGMVLTMFSAAHRPQEATPACLLKTPRRGLKQPSRPRCVSKAAERSK